MDAGGPGDLVWFSVYLLILEEDGRRLMIYLGSVFKTEETQRIARTLQGSPYTSRGMLRPGRVLVHGELT